jgi:hypothetical protein
MSRVVQYRIAGYYTSTKLKVCRHYADKLVSTRWHSMAPPDTNLNGTIALDGEIIEGVKSRLHWLSNLLNISIVTADMHGNAQRLGKSLRVKIHKVDPGDEQAQKGKPVSQHGAPTLLANPA